MRLTPEGEIIREEYSDFAMLAKIGTKLPIIYADWHRIPKETNEKLWQEVLV
jgi:hypothetical protein